MSTITREITDLVDMLPEYEQNLAYELVKRIVLAWDSDFTRLTSTERQRLEQADRDFVNGDTVSIKDIEF